jgi:hypothetical protein
LLLQRRTKRSAARLPHGGAPLLRALRLWGRRHCGCSACCVAAPRAVCCLLAPWPLLLLRLLLLHKGLNLRLRVCLRLDLRLRLCLRLQQR